MLLRRASTHLGFTGLGNLKEQEQEIVLKVVTEYDVEDENDHEDHIILEETEEEIEDPRGTEEVHVCNGCDFLRH